MTETSSEPTNQDRSNAENRQRIAAHQNAIYAEAERLALGALGPGWRPWMFLSLLDSDYHRTDETTPVATAIKVYRGELKISSNSLFIRKMPDGQVRVATSCEPLFGDLLTEPHPTKRLELKGESVPAPRWTLCWSALERYEPRSADQLAALRVSRERGKAEREKRKWAEENPLLAWSQRVQEEEGPER